MPRPRPSALLIPCGLAVVVVVVLLPWWRNHHYLRDLYDYGLVLAANGHLDHGERPYVDFTTPIQAGFLGLNWLVEKAGGGTYAALTWGGAGLIVATALLLTLMLARRWPWWAAVAVGGAVTAAGASQHTILWHNALGVSCLALASWAAACAPVLRRATWPWHLIAGAGLSLGGINKLNFQLIALAATLAWAVRAGLVRSAGWGRVAATVLAALLAGAVLPLAAELAWTGASLRLWLANVVELAAGSRIAILRQILSVDFLLRPLHDYYGPLWLPQVGLIGGLFSLGALVGCWPGRMRGGAPGADRWLLPLAVGLASAGGAALLATNYEIAWVGLGAWLVLVVSVWLGFAPTVRPLVVVGGLVLPALVLGVPAWRSAWTGQRSQFGYSLAPRDQYVPATAIGPAFAGLAGLRLPPDLMLSLTALDQSLPDADATGHRPVFYGLGTEWIGRYLPGEPRKGEPLWIHWGTSYSPAAVARLKEWLIQEGQSLVVLTTLARDDWPEQIRVALDHYYFTDLVGPVIRRWTRGVNLSDSLKCVSAMGGNVDGRVLHFDLLPLVAQWTADGRMVLGTTRRTGAMLLQAPTYRFGGVAVVDRRPGAGAGPLAAEFKVIVHGASPEDVRWSARVELPAGQQSASVPFKVDASGKELQFWISRPEGSPPGLLAGFRELEITHAIESTAGAPRLRDACLPEVGMTPESARSLFGDVTWRPQQLVVRGGRAGAQGWELPAGGEVWLHTDGMTGEIRGKLAVLESSARPGMVRVLWYKGGRLQILQQNWLQRDRAVDFRAWTAEPGGWIGLLVDPGEGMAPAVVRLTGSTLTP